MSYRIGEILYPSTIEEALEDFLNAELPLEHGGNLVYKFKTNLERLGLTQEQITTLMLTQLPKKPGYTGEF